MSVKKIPSADEENLTEPTIILKVETMEHSRIEFEIQGKQYLLESCTICEMIRGYEILQAQGKILYQEISPSATCKGPDGTILVFETTKRSLKELRYCDGQLVLGKQFSVEHADVHSLCFSKFDGIVIMLAGDRKTLTGFHFPTGQVAWQHSEIQLGSSLQVPDERICVLTHKETFALNPVDGTILYMLHRLKTRSHHCSNSLLQRKAAKTGRLYISNDIVRV